MEKPPIQLELNSLFEKKDIQKKPEKELNNDEFLGASTDRQAKTQSLDAKFKGAKPGHGFVKSLERKVKDTNWRREQDELLKKNKKLRPDLY